MHASTWQAPSPAKNAASANSIPPAASHSATFKEVSFGAATTTTDATATASHYEAHKDAIPQAYAHAEDLGDEYLTIQDVTQNESVTSFADVSRVNSSQNAGYVSDLDIGANTVPPKRLIGFATAAELSSGLVDIFA